MADSRIQEIVGTFDAGLTAILALQPVKVRFLANERYTVEPHVERPHPMSPHWGDAKTGRIVLTLDAQVVETVAPEVVTRRTVWIDNVQVNDFRELDTASLIFALINAVKELGARVQELESKGG